jgi:hypothetical protein
MTSMTPAQKVANYIRLRDHKKAATEEFNKSMERVTLAMEKLEAELLNDLNISGAKSLACPEGTVYRQVQLSATVENRDQFRDFVVSQNLWEAMDIKANKTFVREYMDTNGATVPGVKVTQIATVGIRRS